MEYAILFMYFLVVTKVARNRGKVLPVDISRYSRRLAIIAACLAFFIMLAAPLVIAQEGGDSQIFLSGFNAFQQKDYSSAVSRLSEVLKKHPDTPLRDMTLFWLARAYYMSGNRQEAARYMAQFTREYPDNPLKNTVEEELLSIAAQYEKNNAQLIAARAVEDRKARENLERQQIAALKAEEDRKAQEEAERQRLVVARAEAERQRIAAVKADEERKVSEEAERQKMATARAEAERQRAVALKAEEERKAMEEAERQRVAAARAESERQRLAAVKAEEEQKARDEAERQKLALARAEAERQRLATLKAEEERRTREEIERQRIAALKAEEESRALEAARQQRIAAAKAEAERQRIAALKAEEERKVMEEAQRQRIEAARAEAARQRAAALKAEEERKALEELQRQRTAAAKAEAELQRVAALKADEERKALEELQRQRAAAAKAEAERQRVAALKAEEERKALETARQQREAAARAEAERRRVEAERTAEANKAAAAKAKQEQQAMREKAITEYKEIMERFPGTPAARTAASRLRELGIAISVPMASSSPVSVAAGDNSQILTLEVAQYAAFEFNAARIPAAVDVARVFTVPFEIVNRGNGQDSFYLASGFPAEYGVLFMAASNPDKAINQTPAITPGEKFSGIMKLRIPSSTIDGLRISYPVQAASIFMGEVSQSREVSMVASAPLLRAVLKPDKTLLSPGERVTYRVTLLNVGSTAAQDVTLRLNFPPQYQAVDFATAGFRQEMQAALALDGIKLKPGESRELSASFVLREEALAREELVVRADLINNQLQARNSFHGATVFVRPLSSVSVRFASARTVVIPGQTVTLPATVVNTGNQRERFSVMAGMPASQKVTVFHDLNRDGLRQPNEPEVSSIGPLGPREEANLVIEVVTPKNAPDGTDAGLALSVAPESGQGKMVLAQTRLGFSRPVLQLAMKGKGGLLVPGELLTVELSVVNQGSTLAKGVELQATWPEQMELVSSDTTKEAIASTVGTLWKLGELGAAEKRIIKATFKVKPGTIVGTGIQLKSTLVYQDQLGNRY